MSNEIVEDVEKDVIQIGDKIIEEDKITPSIYFDYVKGLKQKIDNNEYDLIIDTALSMLKKTKVTGQTAMAAELTHQLELALRELDAAKDGFDIFVNRKDIERYIENVEAKSIKIIELANYEREIPDEVVDKLEKAQKHFDNIYIIFTDYTKKETKKVAKHRRDKDPIMFGAFHDTTAANNKIYVEDRLFFIADWKEDKCELTLEEIVRDVQDKEDRDITYRVSNPKDEEEVKKMMSSFSKPIEETELEPESIFEKVKKKVARKKTTTPKRRKRSIPAKLINDEE